MAIDPSLRHRSQQYKRQCDKPQLSSQPVAPSEEKNINDMCLGHELCSTCSTSRPPGFQVLSHTASPLTFHDMARFGPGHFVAPAAAFTMAIILGLYVKSSIHRARWEAQFERERQLQSRKAATGEPKST